MMNEILIAVIADAATGEVIERPFTDDEIKEHKANSKADDQAKLEAQAKAEARKSALAKLAALGLTQEEIDSL